MLQAKRPKILSPVRAPYPCDSEGDQDLTPQPTKSVRDLRTQDSRVLAPMGMASKHTPRAELRISRRDPMERDARVTPPAVREICKSVFSQIAHLVDYNQASPSIQRHLAEIINEGAKEKPKIKLTLAEANKMLGNDKLIAELFEETKLASSPSDRLVKISEVVEVRPRAKRNVVEDYDHYPIPITQATGSSSSSSSSAPGHGASNTGDSGQAGTTEQEGAGAAGALTTILQKTDI